MSYLAYVINLIGNTVVTNDVTNNETNFDGKSIAAATEHYNKLLYMMCYYLMSVGNLTAVTDNEIDSCGMYMLIRIMIRGMDTD